MKVTNELENDPRRVRGRPCTLSSQALQYRRVIPFFKKYLACLFALLVVYVFVAHHMVRVHSIHILYA